MTDLDLPTISLPTYEVTIPSTGKTLNCRPFTVAEEKLLLMASESKDSKMVIDTVRQVIKNCILEGEFDFEKSPFFDVDYLFIFLRAKSIGETVEVQLTCNHIVEGAPCGHRMPVALDISKCSIVKDDTLSNDIKLDTKNGVKMKYPSYSLMKHIENKKGVDVKTETIVSSIYYIYDGKGNTFSSKDMTREKMKAFIEGLTEEKYKKLENWIDNFPFFLLEVNKTCDKCGFEHKLRYSDFLDFFF